MNGRIDHSNYEAWLLDRVEGNLTPDQERELDAFLLLHPHLAPEDDELPTVTALADALSNADKAALKRTIPPVGLVSDASVEDHLIARLEGDLDAEQLEALRIYLAAHPQWQRAERAYALTKLVPEAIAYTAKRELERRLPPQGMPTRFTIGDFLIARLEGDLDREQAVAVDRLVAADEAIQRKWVLIQATRTVAAPVVFTGKASLKKKEGRVIAFGFQSWALRLAAAASVAVLLGVGLWLLRSSEGDEQRFARVPAANTEKPAEQENGVEQDEPSTVPQQPERDHTAGPKEHEGPRTSPTNHGARPATPQRMQIVPASPSEEPELAQAPRLEQPTPEAAEPAPMPVADDPGDVQLAQAASAPARPTAPAAVNEHTIGGLLTSTLRERVLDTPARESAPLDSDDAVAAVDRTLKTVAGERAGLDLQRRDDGRVQGFHLRLGRNFAISASR